MTCALAAALALATGACATMPDPRAQARRDEQREADRRATEEYYRRVAEEARRNHADVLWINPPRRIRARPER